jgi:hypothetical protein
MARVKDKDLKRFKVIHFTGSRYDAKIIKATCIKNAELQAKALKLDIEDIREHKPVESDRERSYDDRFNRI